MAATIVTPITLQYTAGAYKVGIAVVNLGVYATGGVAVDPTLFGLTTVYMAMFDGNPNGYAYAWDYTNKKVKVFTQGVTTGGTAAGALANGAFILSDLGTETVIRFSNTAINTTYNFQAMKELANTVDLSSLAYNIRLRLEGV